MRDGAAALAVLLAVLFAAPAFAQNLPASCRTLHVVDNGWHTGIIIPARDFAPARFLGSDYFKGKDWLEFGWGDAGFYQAKEITAGLALRALFWPSEAVMHVYGFNGVPMRVFGKNKVVALRLPEAGYRKLLDGLRGGFARGSGGQVYAVEARTLRPQSLLPGHRQLLGHAHLQHLDRRGARRGRRRHRPGRCGAVERPDVAACGDCRRMVAQSLCLRQ